MSTITIDDQTLRDLFKEALVEVLQERPELFHDVLAEVMENIGLSAAIKEGQRTEPTSKDDVLEELE